MLEPVVYALTRQQIEIKSQAARYEIVEQGKKADGKPYRIGVIDLPSFYGGGRDKDGGPVKSASADVRRILNELKVAGVDGVILDLRSNPGGLLSEAVALAGLFIDEGPVVQVKGSEGRVIRHDDPERGAAYAGPLMVLTSKLSASASEILAHECGHTWQARRLGWLYWPTGALFTLWREGPHWWNHFENQASALGQFGGIVNGSVCEELMRRLRGQ